MFGFKRLLCVLLSLALLSGAACFAETEGAGAPAIYTSDGRVTLIDGACTDAPVNGFEDAAAVVDSVLDSLGGDENTTLEPWRALTDVYGNRYYVFQQMFDNTTVLGGAVKVIADAEGRMIGLTSSIVDNPSEVAEGETIDAAGAECVVLEHAPQASRQALALVDGLTRRMILPTVLTVDVESEDEGGSRYVWVVYTNNPDSSQTRSSDLPYLAHYVTLNGEYLYSLPTIIPDDEAASSGFDASYVFEFMESVNYTGYVDLSTGGELEISVDVMRDRRTGMYYLGNLERRIVVADCWEFLYNGNRVVLESSPDNLQWDQVGLLSLYNYCRAYDYYRAIGWEGGDGLGTPIMVLNNYCDINHKPVDNAAYVGGYLGWQLFLASQCNDFSQCLDVLAHEYTHCVTGSVMTYNAYQNDYGAINEAMSDIQGKTCERLMEGEESAGWTLGANSLVKVRSMEEPHRYSQPAFTWDIFYHPNVRTPTMLNDLGGVHSNSSLLNVLAYRLYEKGGMTLEEGRAFWFTVDCAMVPGTDYAQLARLLPWALRTSGLEKYETVLQQALDATRLGNTDMPESMDADRALLTLRLPDTVSFADEQWSLSVVSLNVDQLIETAKGILDQLMAGDFSNLPPTLRRLMDGGENQPDEALAEASSLLDAIEKEIGEWIGKQLDGLLYIGDTNAGQDGHTMRIVCKPGYAVPALFHGVYNEKTSAVEQTHVLVYVGGCWLDLLALGQDDGKAGEDALSPEMEAAIEAFVDKLIDRLGSIDSVDDVLELVFYRIEGGSLSTLSADGLSAIQPVTDDTFFAGEEDQEAPQPRLSRPKLEEARQAA